MSLSTFDDRKRALERKRYLKSLSPHRRRAYDRLQLCIRTAGQFMFAKEHSALLRLPDMHRCFPIFAKAMGYSGPFYRIKDGRCPAVDISFPETEGSFWFIDPSRRFEDLDEDARKKVQTKKARKAGLLFCKAWLPAWNWDEVVLK